MLDRDSSNLSKESIKRYGRRIVRAGCFALLSSVYLQASSVDSYPLDQAPTRIPTDTPRATYTPTVTRTPNTLATRVVDFERNYTDAVATVHALQAEVTRQAIVLERATGERAQIEGRLNSLEGFDRGVLAVAGGLILFKGVRFIIRRYGGHHGGGGGH